MNYFIVNREQLSRDGNTYELQGYQYGSTNISLILVDVPPGEGPKLQVDIHHSPRFITQWLED